MRLIDCLLLKSKQLMCNGVSLIEHMTNCQLINSYEILLQCVKCWHKEDNENLHRGLEFRSRSHQRLWGNAVIIHWFQLYLYNRRVSLQAPNLRKQSEKCFTLIISRIDMKLLNSTDALISILVSGVCPINYMKLISRTFPFNCKYCMRNDFPKGKVTWLFNLLFYNIVQYLSGGDL